MFFLYVIQDSIGLTPEELKNEQNSLCKKIEQKFLFQIIEKEGICVYIINYKILDSSVLHTEGDVFIKVRPKFFICIHDY